MSVNLHTNKISLSPGGPAMLARLAEVDLIALDAAVSDGPAGQRAQRLLVNRQRIAPQHLPILYNHCA